jgi:methylthioribose-1-phosphate isomerase
MGVEPFECMSIRCLDGKHLEILDQRALPHEETWLPSPDVDAMCALILSLAVRGAPAIGIAASTSLALVAEGILAPHAGDSAAALAALQVAADQLRGSRPTAVNLMVCMDAMTAAARKASELSVF